MIPFGVAFAEWAAVTIVPAIFGVAAVLLLSKWLESRFLAAFGLGIFLWFFVDTIQGSADLGVFAGFSFPSSQVADVLLFLLGVLLFFVAGTRFDRSGSPRGQLRLAALVAVALGVHGFGEGSAFGATASLTTSGDVLAAFGGLSAGLAYVVHKMLEPMMLAAVYVAVAAEGKPWRRQVAEISALAVLFAVPSILGAALGYFVEYDAGYGFALGTGTAVYALALLGRSAPGGQDAPRRDDFWVAISLIAGFILIYAAALLHQ